MACPTDRTADTNGADADAGEKTPLLYSDTGDAELRPPPTNDGSCYRTDSDIESDFYMPRQDLQRRPDDIPRPRSWRDRLAEALVKGLMEAVIITWILGYAAKEAVKKKVKAAWKFVKDHIVYVTVVALGVLVLVAWWMVGPLGFVWELERKG